MSHFFSFPPVVLSKKPSIEFELANNVVNDSLGDVMLVCRKKPFILKVFKQGCVPKQTRTGFIAKNRLMLLDKGEMLNQLFNVPLVLHL
jgi:hypothetical protein